MIHNNKSSPSLSYSVQKQKNAQKSPISINKRIYASLPKSKTVLQFKNTLPQITPKIIYSTPNASTHLGFYEKKDKQVNSFKLIRSKFSQLSSNHANKTITIDPKIIEQIQNSFSIKPSPVIIHSNTSGKDLKRLSSFDLKQKYSDYMKKKSQKNQEFQNYLLLKGELKGWGQKQPIGLATFYESLQFHQ